jgi:hypothetical protein
MTRSSTRLAIVIAAATLARSAPAQVCTGFAGLRATPVQLSAAGAFNSNASGFGAAVTAGKDLFGTFGIGTTSYDALDGSSFDISAGGGYEFPVDQGRRVFVCPIAGLVVSLGPNDIQGSGVDARVVGFSFGFSFGWVAMARPQFALLPSAGIRIAHTKATLEDNAGSTLSTSDTYGLFAVGLGLVLNRVFTIQPAISVPFGLDSADATFGIAVAINFGKRSASTTSR